MKKKKERKKERKNERKNERKKEGKNERHGTASNTQLQAISPFLLLLTHSKKIGYRAVEESHGYFDVLLQYIGFFSPIFLRIH